jgi:short subunit dehydrogenase-like uncharacterized protein
MFCAMPEATPLLLYGVTGYTGRLILAQCVARGLRPVLSGRDAAAVDAIAKEHGLEARPASLGDHDALDRALTGIEVVLHCAGPFSLTAAPMVEACLRRRAHYLDITGEIEVFEMMANADVPARAAGITLLPGVGFDVVPSDCLSMHLKERLPKATSLTLAFTSGGGLSHGTALTMAKNVGSGGAVRRAGRIVRVPAGWHTREIDFGDKVRHCVTIPWGDVSTAFHSTGIPDITVYTAVTRGAARGLKLSRYVAPLLATSPAQALMRRAIDRRPAGPGPERRAAAVSRLWGEAEDAAGNAVRARITAPEGYTLTSLTAVAAAERCLAGGVGIGFQTPSKAFGSGFVLDIPGVERADL